MVKKIIKNIKGGTLLKTSIQYVKKRFSGYEFTFHDIGFHGDEYLLGVVDSLISDCSVFLETGSSNGTTLAYIAKNK